MRLPVLLGVLWLLACTTASYRLFARAATPATVIERRSTPPPASAERPPQPERVLPQQFLRDQTAPVAPVMLTTPAPRSFAPVRTPPPTPYRPPVTGLQPAVPYRVDPLPQPPPAASSAFEPAGVCLACGERADSWVEIDGRRQGYCPKHVSRVRVPSPAGAAPPAPSPGFAPFAAPAFAGASETGSVQCQGMTRAGLQCRRKTRDPSALCYQHRR